MLINAEHKSTKISSNFYDLRVMVGCGFRSPFNQLLKDINYRVPKPFFFVFFLNFNFKLKNHQHGHVGTPDILFTKF